MEGSEFISNKTEGTDFREIVLSHLRKILEISSEELRLKKIYMKGAQGSIELIGEEDTRVSYIQAVESLAHVLLPYFDEIIKEVYQECEIIFNSYNYELKEVFIEKIEQYAKHTESERIPISFFISQKVKYAKKLFVELNLLLNRQDYLKAQVYGEGLDD